MKGKSMLQTRSILIPTRQGSRTYVHMNEVHGMLMKSKDENTKTPIAFCSLATNLDQASFEETTTPSCHYKLQSIMPAGRPVQRLRLPQAVVAWLPQTSRMHFTIRRRYTLPIPTGCVPGSLSNATRRQAMRARKSAHGGWSFAIHLAIAASSLRSI